MSLLFLTKQKRIVPDGVETTTDFKMAPLLIDVTESNGKSIRKRVVFDIRKDFHP